jgi:putative resolvase
LLEIVERLVRREISKVVILYKDRLLRFGFDLIVHFAKIFGVEIEIIDNTEKTEEPRTCRRFNPDHNRCRLQGKRVSKAKKMIKELMADDTGEES